MKLDRILNHVRETKNTPVKLSMKNVITALIATNKGWIIRQLLKYATMGIATATTYLAGKGIVTDDQAAVAYAGSMVTGVVELLLSRMASYEAVKP